MVLSYSDLDTACLATLFTPNGYQPSLLIGLQLLYATGCRPQEVFNSGLWSDYDNDKLALQTMKRGNVRLIDKNVVPSVFVSGVESGNWYFNLVRISQLYGSFVKLWPYPKALVGDKEVKLYAFRYRYVKWLRLEGYTDEQIQVLMGWTSIGLVGRYADSSIIV